MSNSLYQRAALKCDAPARCRCPVCGGLECQCRPRFFAGQLLSDEDLNRLDRYIIAKNKLHNRYLHGWGVVCGLEVACDPCPGFVTVKSGYALGPCGDDIIVCEDTRVDVCELVNACCERPHDECEPPRPVRGDECKDAVRGLGACDQVHRASDPRGHAAQGKHCAAVPLEMRMWRLVVVRLRRQRDGARRAGRHRRNRRRASSPDANRSRRPDEDGRVRADRHM